MIISGILGKMGSSLMEVAGESSLEIAAGFDSVEDRSCDVPIFADTKKLPSDVDCAFDFSSPEGFFEIARFCGENKIPLVSGTTGLSNEHLKLLQKISRNVPVFYATNTSLAVAFLSKAAQDIAKFFPETDIEIVESHHRDKMDAPSGTAMTIAQKILSARGWDENAITFGRHGKTGPRPAKQIAVHSVRAGATVAEHQILFAMPDEEIILIHRARDRKLFARGTIRAAKWLAKKQAGLYSVDNILDSS